MHGAKARGRTLLRQRRMRAELRHTLSSLLPRHIESVFIDGDSFQELGGTPLFKRAQNLVEIAAAAGGAGWSSSTTGNRNRYFLISRMNDPNYDRFRKAYYQYHRRGLDGFIDNPINARSAVYEAINTIWENKRSTADTFVFDVFFNTKYKELTGIFAEAETTVRQQAYLLLTQVDQAHLTEYDKIK